VTQQIKPSPIDNTELIKEYPELIVRDGQRWSEGFVSHQGSIMIVASKPILTSLDEGPSSGTMIFLKVLDKNSMAEISDLALNTINLYTISNIQNDFSTFPDREDLDENFYVLPRGKDKISGF
jgi:sensor domain CHASE-containing protein